MSITLNSDHIFVGINFENETERKYTKTPEKFFYKPSLIKNIFGDVAHEIFSFCDVQSLRTLAGVSKNVKAVVETDRLWRPLFENTFSTLSISTLSPTESWKNYFKHAEINNQIHQKKLLIQYVNSEIEDLGKSIVIKYNNKSIALGVLILISNITELLLNKYNKYPVDRISREVIRLDPKYLVPNYTERAKECYISTTSEECFEQLYSERRTLDALQQSALEDFDKPYEERFSRHISYFVISTLMNGMICFIKKSNNRVILLNIESKVLRYLNLSFGVGGIPLAIAMIEDFPITSSLLIGNEASILAIGILKHRRVIHCTGLIACKMKSLCSKIGSCFSRCFRRR